MPCSVTSDLNTPFLMIIKKDHVPTFSLFFFPTNHTSYLHLIMHAHSVNSYIKYIILGDKTFKQLFRYFKNEELNSKDNKKAWIISYILIILLECLWIVEITMCCVIMLRSSLYQSFKKFKFVQKMKLMLQLKLENSRKIRKNRRLKIIKH